MEFEFFPENVNEFDFFQKMSANMKFKKNIAKTTMSWIHYDACQSIWRFETAALVYDSLSFRADHACLLCAARMCVDLEM